MNERVKAYLDKQEKNLERKEKIERAKILIEADLYESYQGPHVEELFEPIYPHSDIKTTENIQYVIEKATGQPLAVRYDYKQKEFEVLTPLDVTEEEFQQIKLYAKSNDKPIFPVILFVFSLAFYLLAFIMLIFIFSNTPNNELPLALGLGSLGIGLILHALSIVIKKR